MVVGRCHSVTPHIVRELQVFSDFLASHLEYKQQVLKAIQLEHVCLCNLAGIDGGIECQGGVERYVGFRDAHLQIVNQICKCRVAKETLAGVDRILKVSNPLTHVFLNLIDGRLEVGNHLLVDLLVAHIYNVTDNAFLAKLAILVCQRNLCFSHVVYIARGIYTKHLFASFVGDQHVVYLVVVTKEDNVETRNLTGY